MPILQGRTRRYRKACDRKSLRCRRLWLGKVLPQHPLLHGLCIRSMPTGFHFTGRRKTGNSMGLRSAELHLPTGSSTVHRTISSQCMITITVSLLKRSFAMADETRVQVLNEEGRRAQTQSFMWLFPKRRGTGFRRSSCMAIPRPGAAAMRESSWKATADTWKQMDIRDTTISQGSDAALVGAYPSILYRCRSQRKTV